MNQTKFYLPPLVLPFLSLSTGIIFGNFLSGFRTSASVFIFIIISALVFTQFCWLLKPRFRLFINNNPGLKNESFKRASFLFKRESRNSFYVILFFFVGYILISSLLFPHLKDNHISKFTDKGKFWIIGKVVSTPEKSGRKKRLVLSVKRVGKDALNTVPATGRIKLSIYSRYGRDSSSSTVKYGDLIKFKAKIKSIHNFKNPGGFDYKRYLRLRNIYASSFTNYNDIVFLSEKKEHRLGETWLCFMEDYRKDFSQFIVTHVKDKKSAAVLSALITGKKDLIDKETRNDFSKAGASHVLAISGLHLSVVATLFFYLFNKILSLFTFLLIRGWSRKGAALLTLIPLLFYAFLSGFSPSTKRAFIMITVFMFSFVAAREADTLNSLAFAGILILFIDPGSIFSISFQLSFAAVFFIILGLFSIKKIEFFKEKNLKNRFFLFVFISFCAIAGTLPIVVYYFNIISFAGIFTNIVLIPGAGFFAVPLGLAGLFIYPVSMAAASLFIKCAGLILFFCILFIEYVANLPFAWARCVTPDMIEILCYYIFTAGIFFFINFSIKVHPIVCNHRLSKFAVADENDHAPAMQVYKKKAFVSVLAALIIFLIDEALWINQRFFNEKLYVTVMDVGQGSSALIEMPMGKRVLVDGGGFTYFSKFDTGEHIVAPFLWKKKIMTLDAVILTHPEADHMNGLVYILKNFKIKRFIKNCDTRETKAFLDLMNLILIDNIKLDIVSDMKTKVNMGKAFFDILYPFYGADAAKVKAGDFNNNSVVFKLCFNNISILFPGDIMEQTEEKLALTLGKRLESDILIAPHHGSLTSSSNFFLDQVRPESVIVSCGWKNRFGFPDLSIVQRYRQRGIRVYRTDLSGAVQIIVGSEQLTINSE